MILNADKKLLFVCSKKKKNVVNSHSSFCMSHSFTQIKFTRIIISFWWFKSGLTRLSRSTADIVGREVAILLLLAIETKSLTWKMLTRALIFGFAIMMAVQIANSLSGIVSLYITLGSYCFVLCSCCLCNRFQASCAMEVDSQ